MLGWLEQLTHPDGEIAYFNDSVQGLAAAPSALRAYAVRLGVKHVRFPLGPSGYVRLDAGETIVLFDAGPVGPDYQPGHGHCDLLSLEISHRGSRAISNSGVSTYEPCPRRLAERGTAAHNTLRLDGAEQSEVWRQLPRGAPGAADRPPDRRPALGRGRTRRLSEVEGQRYAPATGRCSGRRRHCKRLPRRKRLSSRRSVLAPQPGRECGYRIRRRVGTADRDRILVCRVSACASSDRPLSASGKGGCRQI